MGLVISVSIAGKPAAAHENAQKMAHLRRRKPHFDPHVRKEVRCGQNAAFSSYLRHFLRIFGKLDGIMCLYSKWSLLWSKKVVS